MKRIIIAMILALVLIASFITPAFAADPPDTEVNVSVSSPGDVDLNVGINSGGDTNVIVDGVDFKETNQLAVEAYRKSHEPKNGWFDFVYYWGRTGIAGQIDVAFSKVWESINILFTSQAKMIQELDAANARIDELEARIEALENK